MKRNTAMVLTIVTIFVLGSVVFMVQSSPETKLGVDIPEWEKGHDNERHEPKIKIIPQPGTGAHSGNEQSLYYIEKENSHFKRGNTVFRVNFDTDTDTPIYTKQGADIFIYDKSEKKNPLLIMRSAKNRTDTDIYILDVSEPNPEPKLVTTIQNYIRKKTEKVVDSFTRNRSMNKNTIVLSRRDREKEITTMYSIDISVPNTELKKITTIRNPHYKDGERSIGSTVWFVDNGAALAYISHIFEEVAHAGDSILHIISLSDGKEIERYSIGEKIRLYGGLYYTGQSSDGRLLYLEEGHEFGPIGYFYIVDRDKKQIHNFNDEAWRTELDNTRFRDFSPNGNYLAVAGSSTSIPERDQLKPCLELEQKEKFVRKVGIITVHNLKNNTKEEIYKNAMYNNDGCSNNGNEIKSLKWLDNSRIVFITVGGGYIVDTHTEEKETLFTFEEVDTVVADRSIQFVQTPYIHITNYHNVSILFNIGTRQAFKRKNGFGYYDTIFVLNSNPE